ncbi:MAG: hypothetical protein JST00_25300 [Deltaproteobacteria bacterium]|nr:hypothetical protein [Deltaproteobacteria bacterium]
MHDERERSDDGVVVLRFAIVLGTTALAIAAWLFTQRGALEHACMMGRASACERLAMHFRAFGWLGASGAALLLTVVLAWLLRGESERRPRSAAHERRVVDDAQTVLIRRPMRRR